MGKKLILPISCEYCASENVTKSCVAKEKCKLLSVFCSESTSVDKSVSHSCTTPSTSSASGLNPTSAPTSSTSTVPVSPVPQSPIPPLLQDPNLLRQLLPALQATLQLNNSSVDISKINEGKDSKNN